MSGEAQRFGTLRDLPIAMPAEARKQSAELLNGVLADSTIVYALCKKHHWLIAGPTFYQLHLLFDEHAEEQAGLIRAPDRIRARGCQKYPHPDRTLGSGGRRGDVRT